MCYREHKKIDVMLMLLAKHRRGMFLQFTTQNYEQCEKSRNGHVYFSLEIKQLLRGNRFPLGMSVQIPQIS